MAISTLKSLNPITILQSIKFKVGNYSGVFILKIAIPYIVFIFYPISQIKLKSTIYTDISSKRTLVIKKVVLLQPDPLQYLSPSSITTTALP